MTEFKAYATRALNQFEGASIRRWADHGSTRYLWDIDQLADAVNYVVNQQGRPMARYINPHRPQSSEQSHLNRNPERKRRVSQAAEIRHARRYRTMPRPTGIP